MSFIRKLYLFGFLIYLPFLIIITFFFPERERAAKTYEYHFIPLESTIAQIKDPAQYNTPTYWQVFTESLAGNFILFIPLGFFLRFFISHKKLTLLLYGMALSMLIELIQLIFHLGVCDIDDVILNSAGTFAGIALCSFFHFNQQQTNY